MRSRLLPKSLLLAVVGCVVLSGCGTRNATTDLALAGSGVSAVGTQDAAPSDEEFLQFLELMNNMPSSCAQEVADEKGVLPEDLPAGGVPPEPEQAPDGKGGPGPEHAPGGSSPEPLKADEGIPVRLPDAPAPPEPDPDVTPPDPKEEVTLNAAEECFGGDHVRRVSEAFENTKTADYQAMQKKLTDLGYPAAYIHRMPDHEGAPRARVDLRLLGSRLALEVTGTSSGVSAEAFGASEEEGVNVADVKRKPKQGAPAS
ncbi:hypothetical protein [Streptomyces sp. AP-93]|uniref:hypothetical protein n=1 Tax=Streptomyces sp. AP-93 TaxID=2929048 RepID=UPI001FAFD4C4|nr:hypothetical protein [Streptomyces sp. AP-93]MCJ0871198.1 hypothetical protein [Streptomyces sp. AP-93]